MKKEGVEKFAILAVLAVMIVFIFMNASFNFTGNVVLEDYANQSACETAGYTWENLTECETDPDCIECEEGCIENGEEIVICVEGCVDSCEECSEDCLACEESDQACKDENCVEGCVESCAEVEVCEDGCVQEDDLCVDGCELSCIFCDESWGCTGDICDSTHLNLCLDESSCTGVSGYWYDNICNSEEQCIPETCASLNYECGSVSDGCDSTLDCGACGSGHTCSSGTCEEDETSDDDSNNEKIKSTTIISSNPVTGSAVSDECTSDWQCSGWSECVDETQTRTCEDVNNCGSQEGIPATSQSCAIAETCFDGIKNQNEKGVDCGGVCEKKCSIFTMVGSVITGPIESGKEFFVKNKVIVFVLLGIIVLGVGGFFGLKFFLKKSNKKVSEFFLNLFPKKLPFFNTTKI